MDPRTRKLLLMPEHDPSIASSSACQPDISSNTSSAITRNRNRNESSYNGNGAAGTGYGGFNAYRLSQPFDSSMAFTVLVLLTALFFIGFFSIYIRRFADDSSVDPSRFRRRRPASLPAARSAAKGVSPETVDSLPVYRYNGGGAKQGIVSELECAICLTEFEEGECVKVIPFCGHVFHEGCIGMWLAAHVTCPLCRTAKLFPAREVAVAEQI